MRNMTVQICVKCGKRTNNCPNYFYQMDDERSSALIYSALCAEIA